jgi:hypothetical protein
VYTLVFSISDFGCGFTALCVFCLIIYMESYGMTLKRGLANQFF